MDDVCCLSCSTIFERETPRSSIVVCVSPLVSNDGPSYSKYSSKGLTTQFLGEAQGNYYVISRVLEGEYQLVFISPEALLRNKQWKPSNVRHNH